MELPGTQVFHIQCQAAGINLADLQSIMLCSIKKDLFREIICYIIKMMYFCGMKSSDEILNILTKFKSENTDLGIKILGLFGSYARGEQNESSDIDICIKLENTNFLNFYRVKSILNDLFGTNIDLVSLHKYLDPTFVNSINRDIIYV